MTIHSIDLNGVWQLRWTDGQRGDRVSRLLVPEPDLSQALEACVPGEVHLDLLRAGLIGEPGEGLNALAARWVEETIWYYARTFTAPALAPGQQTYLVFEGLDLAATVYLNGKAVGAHHNAFYPCRLDVSAALLAGENRLLVAIESGLFSVSERPSSGYGLGADGPLHKRQWLRKTQSSFSWDWSARLINVGIHGAVRLEIAQDLYVEGCAVLASVSAGLDQGTATGRLFVQGLGSAAHDGLLRIVVAETGESAALAVQIQPGANRLEVAVPVVAPQLWWPVGHGAQPLYTVTLSLQVGGAEVASVTRRAGFRQVEVDQRAHPQGGRYFTIRVNGKPIFVKGGNFVPADMILARLDRARYETLVDRALEANCNMLRIWGGGLYESDDFYTICDERGVLVWQEFIFACAKYPAHDEAFLADVKREATYQVRRLAHHPSLVIWCGNNELEWGTWSWGYERGVAHPDYALYHHVLPVIVNAEDGTRYYQPSSPYSPDHLPPNQDNVGDQHPWSVGFADTDFRKYRAMACRFPNEGGILGPTALPTVLAALGNGAVPGDPAHDRRPAPALAWEMHDNSIAYSGNYSYPDAMLEQWLGIPRTAMTIEDYVYFGGLVQGQGLAEYVRNFRRRMFDTSSAIFWMYNDCWPATRSWTIVDYYLRRTPAFHPVRRAFAPLSVALAVEDGRVRVFGVNEGAAWQGSLRYGLCALAGGYPLDFTQAVELPANASTLLAEFDMGEWARLGERSHVAFAVLESVHRELARDVLFLPYFKEMDWPPAQVDVRVEAGHAVFTSDVFAWRVCLDLSGEVALPDNFFDVLPGIPTVLAWSPALGEPHILRVGNLTGQS